MSESNGGFGKTSALTACKLRTPLWSQSQPGFQFGQHVAWIIRLVKSPRHNKQLSPSQFSLLKKAHGSDNVMSCRNSRELGTAPESTFALGSSSEAASIGPAANSYVRIMSIVNDRIFLGRLFQESNPRWAQSREVISNAAILGPSSVISC